MFTVLWLFPLDPSSLLRLSPLLSFPIILDHNATTRPAPEVVDAMHQMLAELWHNPSSIHRPGQSARQKMDLARQDIARLLGVRPRHITLTGSGTEALDLAIRGHLLARGLVGRASAGKPPATIITSPTEHIGVRDLARALEREEGVRVLWAELDAGGRVSVESIAKFLDEHHAPAGGGGEGREVALVSVQWANNEVGTIQPVWEIGKLCRDRGVTFHCDATQWVGKMPTRVNGEGTGGSRDHGNAAIGGMSENDDEPAADWASTPLDVDLLTCSPHKFHGPKGVGVLYARPGVRTATLIHGEQELGRRGGTENIAGIIGAGAACKLAAEWLADQDNRVRGGELRDHFERSLLASVPNARINGSHESERDRLWNTSSIGFPRLEAEALLMLLSERGIACSAGAACSSGSLEASPVLKAMRIDPLYAHGTLRFSISRETTRDEIVRAVPIISDCVARLRQSMSGLE